MCQTKRIKGKEEKIDKEKYGERDDYWNMMLNDLINLDEEHLIALENMIRQKEIITRFYKRKGEIENLQSREFGLAYR